MNFQFQHKELILLFAAVGLLILLFIWILFWKMKVKQRMGDKKLIDLLTGTYSSKFFTSKFIVVSVAFAIGVIAAMNPRQAGAADDSKRKGIDIAIALDVSKSMLATDLPPNRLERAKQFINKLINEMPDDRIALVWFAGKAYLQMPLSVDHGAAQLYISSAGPAAVPQQGTVISGALKMSAAVFNAADKRFKSVIVISDGEDHDEAALSTAKRLAENGVMISTIGIGSPEGSTIIDPSTGQIKKDDAGNTIISRLNEEGLKEIAEATNGIYVRLQNSDEAVAAVKAQLSQIEKKAFNDVSVTSFKNYFIWFAAAMFVLLLAENFIPERKKAKA
ncbi:MAG: VWA domain-containing protein [Chitinophagaceae bacterium]|nr:VWA domain-containing protein [Chitinophagaceae bacterium]